MRHLLLALAFLVGCGGARPGPAPPSLAPSQPIHSPTTVLLPWQPSPTPTVARWSTRPLASPSPRPFRPEQGQPPSDLEEAQLQFARDCLNVLPYTRVNAVWSPWGLYRATLLAGLGARGSTADRISGVLQSPLDVLAAEVPRVRGLWQDEVRVFHQPDVTILPAYAQRVKSAFGAAPATMDHFAPWLQRVTRAGSFDPVMEADAPIVVAHAFHLEQPWVEPLEDLGLGPFRSHGETQSVPFVGATRTQAFAERPGYRLLELSLGDGGLAFDCLLPDGSVGLEALERSLTRREMQDAFAALQDRRVDFRIPKFAFRDDRDARAQLVNLGLPREGDFSRLTRDPRSEIRGILGATGVRLDEEGLQASGATVLQIYPASVRSPDPVARFHVDRPALFLVRDRKSGVVLLMGRIVQPG